MEQKVTITGKEAKAMFEAELAYEAEGMMDEAEERVYEVLDLLKLDNVSKETKNMLIGSLGNMVAEISAMVNGYFDDNFINKSFSDFIA